MSHLSVTAPLPSPQSVSVVTASTQLPPDLVGFRLPDVLVGTGVNSEGDAAQGEPDEVYIGSYDATGKFLTWGEETIDLAFDYAAALPSSPSPDDATYAVLAAAWAAYTQAALAFAFEEFTWTISAVGRFLLFTPSTGSGPIPLGPGNSGLPIIVGSAPEILAPLDPASVAVSL